jgi:para-nitrobenzyl esterase
LLLFGVALQFVQREIAHFGGDARRVTLIGHSSGATNALALLGQPRVQRTLLHAVVSLSGSPNITMSLSAAERQNTRLLSQHSACGVGGGTSVLTCLRAMSASQLVALSSYWSGGSSALPSQPAGLSIPGLVIVDGRVVQHSSLDAHYTVPVLISTMQNEVDIFIPQQYLPTTQTQFQQQLAAAMRGAWSPSAAHDIGALYAHLTPTDAYTRLVSDVQVSCAAPTLATRHPHAFLLLNTAPPDALVTSAGTLSLPFHTWGE